MTDTLTITQDEDLLIRELQAAGCEIGKDKAHCKCGFHDDQHGSLSIFTDKTNGKARFKCMACGVEGTVIDCRMKATGCTAGEAIRALNGDTAPVQRTPAKTTTVYATFDKLKAAAEYAATAKGGNLAAVWRYDNPDTGEAELVIFRVEKLDGSKVFSQARREGTGFVFGGLKINPLYGRAGFREAQTVVVCEGEKCADKFRALGFTATTSPGGSGAATKADWTPLAGKQIILWPDNDSPGRKYSQSVINELRKLEPRPDVRVVDVAPLGLPEGGDIADFVEALEAEGKDEAAIRASVQAVLDTARAVGPLADLDEELAAAVRGERYAVTTPWPVLDRLTRAFCPGTVTLLCGSPGTTKSLFALQADRFWAEANIRAALLELEDGLAYHLRRALAQIGGESSVTDDAWVKAHPGRLAELQARAKAELTRLEPCLEAPVDADALTAENLLAWVKFKAAAGKRIIAIDPITGMQKGPRPWEDDRNFILGAKRIVEQAKASLLLVSHPVKAPFQPKQAPALGDLAGGAAYERFAHTILFLKAHEAKDATVSLSLGRAVETINRTIIILKSRNGAGTGRKIGFWFNAQNLTLQEKGEITGD